MENEEQRTSVFHGGKTVCIDIITVVPRNDGRRIPAVMKSEVQILRENAGPYGLERTLRTALETLADHDIPHLLIGGMAVQELGYPRVTVDVDIVVPDVREAVEWLTADLSGPFIRVASCEDRVQDKRNQVFVDILPAGRVVKRGCKIPFPQPTVVSEAPQLVSLEQLISLKLDSWANSPLHVRQSYVELWDGLQSEK